MLDGPPFASLHCEVQWRSQVSLPTIQLHPLGCRQLDQADVAKVGGHMQRGLALSLPQVGVSLMGDQKPGHILRVVLCRQVEWGPPLVLLGIHAGPLVQEQMGGAVVPILGCKVQGGPAVLIHQVGICAVLQEPAYLEQ